jgi:hypothetical protein
MERTLTQIEAEIASLREKATHYRELALRHREADNIPIADKLLELVADLERSAAELWAVLKQRRRAS